MKRLHNFQKPTLLFFLLFFSGVVLQAQINFTAKDGIAPYSGLFRPGSNLGYLPLGWSNKDAADLLVGNPSRGIPGVGVRSVRPSLAHSVLYLFGDDIEKDEFEYYFSLGMDDLTAFVEGPADEWRDFTEYCPGKPSEMFKNLYLPIWDGGANGTPVNDDNYFALYMYRVVTKYKDYVKFWEIWNEPSFTGTDKAWRPKGYPGNWWENNPDPCDYKLHAPVYHYLRTLRIAYEVVKSVAPDDYVVVAGLGYPSFLDVLLRNTDNPVDGSVTPEYPNRGGAYFDVLGIHAYPSVDGSLRYWDNNLGWVYSRTSDDAAERVITKRFDAFEQVLAGYGYDGTTYPKKLRTITETNISRIKLTDESIASDEAQRNFLMKSAIINKVNHVIQMHVYSIDDLQPEWNITNEFEAMGFYKKFSGQPENQTRNNSGIGYKTMADFITETTYDPARTAALALPQGIKGFAFKRPDNTYVYALWARTTIDNSEEASANYSFPAGIAAGTLKRCEWDYSLTGESSIVSPQNIHLTGSPSFFEVVNPANKAPVATLSTPATTVNGPFEVTVHFSESVTGMDASKLVLTNAYITDFSGSGDTYTVMVHPAHIGPVTLLLPQGSVQNSTGQTNVSDASLKVIYDYCRPRGNVTYVWLKEARFNSLSKYSAKRPYNDFTDVAFNFDKSQTIPVKLVAHIEDPSAPTFFRVWLDLNQDGEIKMDELVFQGKGANAGLSSKLFGNFQVPAEALTGKTRMRVTVSLFDFLESPCAEPENGEVEDYSVIISGEGGGNGCIIYVTQNEKICDDMGTPIEKNDDEFTINMTVEGNNTSSNWYANINGQTLTGAYGVATDFGPYLINDNKFTAYFYDAGNASCKVSTLVVPPPHCSDFQGVPTTNYCVPKSNDPWAEWIQRVQFGTIDNTSSHKPYSDFSYLSTDVEKGQSYPVTLTTGFGYYTHDEFWQVWIDFNQNEVFESDEIVFHQNTNAPSNGTTEQSISGMIAIPQDAVEGSTLMRIAMARDYYQGPCQWLTHGEYEDYRVNIVGDTDPVLPGCSQVIVPADNAVDVPLNTPLAWTAASNADGYQLSIGTTPGATDVLNHLDLGNVTGYQPFPFPHNSTFYVKITPYNEQGENDGCAASKFTTIDTTTVSGGGGGTDCPTQLPDFEFLGSFEGHNYFISSGMDTWVNAQAGAEAVQGHLVTFDSQAENDFVKDLVSEIAFIGLSDHMTEGDFQWVDGTPVTYTRFSDCSWCVDNSDAMDFYAMFPWDGSWALDNQWVHRRYIIELDCDNQGPTTCDLDLQASAQCLDNGTPDNAADDQFIVTFDIDGSDDWALNFAGINLTGSNATASIGPVSINQFSPGQQLTATLTDQANPSCTVSTVVTVPNTCSNGGGGNSGVDLELTLSVTPPSPGQWQSVTAYLTIENTGTETATGVVVDFFDQSVNANWSKLGFAGKIVPAGTFFNDWTGVWTIPSIASGQAYVLEYQGFTKVPGAIPMFAQVAHCDQPDTDSSPANNSTQNPVEDDEALVVINQSGAQVDGLPSYHGDLQKEMLVYPNPAGHYVVVELPAPGKGNLVMINVLGEVVLTRSMEGRQAAVLDLSLLKSGTYFILLDGQHRRIVKK